MKDNKIIASLNRVYGKASLSLKKHSPEILIAVGVVGTVASAVLACKATTKVSKILEETKNEVDTVHKTLAQEDQKALAFSESDKNLEATYEPEYTVEDSKKDLTIIYAQTGMKFMKLYGPAIALETLSIVSIFAGHNIIRKRNVALAAAYTAVNQGFTNYRKRVIDRFGEDVDHELRYNIKAKKVEEEVTDPETGKVKKIKKTVEVANPDTDEGYIYYYDRTCTGWEPNREYCLFNLRALQQYANDMLIARGHLFLNEVLDQLGLPRSQKGQAVGWIYRPDDVNRDSHVDFRIQETYRENEQGLLEPVIMLDFNVDGCIFYDFDKPKLEEA